MTNPQIVDVVAASMLALVLTLLAVVGFLKYKWSVDARADEKFELPPDLEEESSARELALLAENERLSRERDEAAAAKEEAMRAIVRVDKNWAPNAGLPAAPSAEDLATFTRGAQSMQCRMGRGIFVSVLVCPEGVVVDWKADVQGAVPPEVVGSCDGRKIFKEFAWQGRHADRFAPGRHRLAFAVRRGEQDKSKDLFFDIYVPPEPAKVAPAKHWKEELEEKTSEFFDRTQAVTAAKKKIEAELRSQGYDDDAIDHVLGQYESMFNYQGG